MWFAYYFCKTIEEQWYAFQIFIVNVKVKEMILIENVYFSPYALQIIKLHKMFLNLQIGISFHLCFIHSFTVSSLWGPVILLGHKKIRCGILVKVKKAVYVRKDFPTTILATSAKIFIVDKNTSLKMWPCWRIAPKMFWGLVWVVKGDSEVLLRLKFVFYKSYCSNISCVCTIVRLFTQLTELFTHILHCMVGSSVLLLTDRSDKSWFSRGVNINIV